MSASAYWRTLREKVGHDLLLMPAAGAIIMDDAGRVLLQRRSDNGLWGLPGGAMEPGEEPAETVIREVYEETGLHVRPERIVGVYAGSDSIVQYPNGDRAAVVSVTFLCKIVGGGPGGHDDETLELRYFSPDALPDDLLPHHRKRIQHAVTQKKPYFWSPKTGDGL